MKMIIWIKTMNSDFMGMIIALFLLLIIFVVSDIRTDVRKIETNLEMKR